MNARCNGSARVTGSFISTNEKRLPVSSSQLLEQSSEPRERQKLTTSPENLELLVSPTVWLSLLLW